MSVRIVAAPPVPLNNAIKGSNPPDGTTTPLPLVPPPNPQVWMETSDVPDSENVVVKTSVGSENVPTNDIVLALAPGARTNRSTLVSHTQVKVRGRGLSITRLYAPSSARRAHNGGTRLKSPR